METKCNKCNNNGNGTRYATAAAMDASFNVTVLPVKGLTRMCVPALHCGPWSLDALPPTYATRPSSVILAKQVDANTPGVHAALPCVRTASRGGGNVSPSSQDQVAAGSGSLGGSRWRSVWPHQACESR